MDYPPFFALFELGLSQLAKWVDLEILVLSQERITSPSAHTFLRLSVIASDAVLVSAAAMLAKCALEHRDLHLAQDHM
jgi:alpha-1,3-glucosyltransferase